MMFNINQNPSVCIKQEAAELYKRLKLAGFPGCSSTSGILGCLPSENRTRKFIDAFLGERFADCDAQAESNATLKHLDEELALYLKAFEDSERITELDLRLVIY